MPSTFERFRYLLRLVGEHAWSLGAGAGFLALTLWMSLAIPRYLQEAIDLLAAGGSGSAVLAKVWLILGFAVAMVLTRTVSRMLFLVPGRRVEFDLKNRLLAHLLGQDREYFLANPTGELISRINNDINGVRMLLGMGTMMLIQTAGTLTLAPWYMYRISPGLTLYCALPIAVGFLVLQVAVQRMRRNQQRHMKALQELSDFTVESYGGLDPLKSFRGLGWAEHRFAALSGEVRDAGLGMAAVRAWFFPLLTHLVNGLKVLLGAGGRLRGGERGDHDRELHRVHGVPLDAGRSSHGGDLPDVPSPARHDVPREPARGVRGGAGPSRSPARRNPAGPGSSGGSPSRISASPIRTSRSARCSTE